MLLKEVLQGVKALIIGRKKPEFWDSLEEMPCYYWIQIHKTGDLMQLLKSGQPYASEVKKAWHKLNNEYLSTYGMNEKNKRVYYLRKRIIQNLCDYLITGDRRYEMEADILKVELEGETEGEKAVNYGRITTMIEKYFGFQINTMETSTAKYLDYLEVIKENNNKVGFKAE
jgi:uncharacterized protein YxjI